jgi:hypothetical protein
MSQFASTGAHYVQDHSRIAWAALGALVAVGATFLVLALAGVFESDNNSAAALPTSSGSGGSPTVQYNGGHEEGQAGLSTPAISRYDGGPEEGTAGPFGGVR